MSARLAMWTTMSKRYREGRDSEAKFGLAVSTPSRIEVRVRIFAVTLMYVQIDER